jgi:hypothetical protein
MAIVMTFSIPMIHIFAVDTPLLLEPHDLIVDHSLPKEEANTQIIAARRYDTFWNTGDETLARACWRRILSTIHCRLGASRELPDRWQPRG